MAECVRRNVVVVFAERVGGCPSGECGVVPSRAVVVEVQAVPAVEGLAAVLAVLQGGGDGHGAVDAAPGVVCVLLLDVPLIIGHDAYASYIVPHKVMVVRPAADISA